MCNIIIRYFTIWEGGVGSLMIVQMAPLHSSSAPCETLFLKTFQFSSQPKSFFGDTAFSYPSFPHLVIFTSHRALTRKALFLPICPGANNPNSQNTWFLLLLLLLRHKKSGLTHYPINVTRPERPKDAKGQSQADPTGPKLGVLPGARPRVRLWVCPGGRAD